MAIDKTLGSKELLINAACDLFAERGYDAVSTREIADKAGVNLGAIQYHFGSKEHLFLEAIRNFMQGSGCFQASSEIPSEISSKEEASIFFARYIQNLLEYMVLPRAPHPCRIMFREILSRTSTKDEIFETLVSTVVAEFIRPADSVLISLLSKLSPKLTKSELELFAHSIIGQCSFYFTHGPFAERLRSKSFSERSTLDEITKHIITFSLRALECEEAHIKSAISSIEECIPMNKVVAQ